jgi:hypothetical protein
LPTVDFFTQVGLGVGWIWLTTISTSQSPFSSHPPPPLPPMLVIFYQAKFNAIFQLTGDTESIINGKIKPNCLPQVLMIFYSPEYSF